MALKVRRALISVWDKTGISDFARALNGLGVEIVSTGGTADALKKEGVPVIPVSDVTGFPEMMDGRVKTLHPKIHGGILARRDVKEHMGALAANDITPIDMVVVNLYPFQKTVAKPDVTLEEAIENIDIGGPSMVRAAAKNYGDVVVVVNPARYDAVIKELKEKGDIDPKLREELALEAFNHTAEYDGAISNWLGSRFNGSAFPPGLHLYFKKVQDLRYGENWHQKAAFYKELSNGELSIGDAEQLHGKELSYNNICDLSASLEICKQFDKSAAVIVKHNNPCGVACGENIAEAYKKAFDTDPTSAFGGVIAINRKVDAQTAEEITKIFMEVVIAPAYDAEALVILKKKKDLRIMVLPVMERPADQKWDFKHVLGGMLYQTGDNALPDVAQLKVVTKRAPTEKELQGLLFAWKVCKITKSNSIILTDGEETLGIGSGQTSRIDAMELAVKKAKKFKGRCNGVVASDSFFPFPDCVNAAGEVGITAIIQPGGSIKDQESIDAADKHNIAMVFTGIRCFKH